MAIKVAINGFGRIGRLTARVMKQRGDEIDLVAINDHQRQAWRAQVGHSPADVCIDPGRPVNGLGSARGGRGDQRHERHRHG